jgi:hypothetical protein
MIGFLLRQITKNPVFTAAYAATHHFFHPTPNTILAVDGQAILRRLTRKPLPQKLTTNTA